MRSKLRRQPGIRLPGRFPRLRPAAAVRRLALEALEERTLLAPVPIHHWRLDEGQGITVADSVGSANGTLVGFDGDAWSPGYLGKSLAFDGVDDHVSIGPAASLRLEEQVTISAWVNVAAGGFTNWHGIAGWVHDTGSDESGYCLNVWSGGGFSFGLASGSGRDGFNYLTRTGYQTDTWYHVAGTYDGRTQRLYVDGLQVGLVAKLGAINWEWLDGDGFEIGRYHDNNEDLGFRGRIDDVRVFDRALDASEINELASETPTGNSWPVAGHDAVIVEGPATVTINVLANDVDADGDSLIVGDHSQPADGSLREVGDGRFTYTPGPNFLNGDRFTYVVSDGNGGTDTATVSLLAPPVGQWEFDDPAHLTKATLGNELGSVGSPTAASGMIPGDGAARLGEGDYYIVEHGLLPSGAGSRVNRYTLLFDFQVPTLDAWRSFFQTSTANADDGDLFVRPVEGTVGAGSTGYSATSIEPSTWYRLAVVVDNGSRFDVYLDGEKILNGLPQPIDGRFSLGERLLICADDDGEDGAMDLSTVALFDRPLSDEEVAGLGGPYRRDPDNEPPRMVIEPAGPEAAQTQTEIAMSFRAEDADGDWVQFRVDFGDGETSSWSDFQSAELSFVVSHAYNANGAMPIRAEVRDEHGATSGPTLIQTIDVTGDVIAEILTMPYLQNVTPESMVIMWETDAQGPITVEYGLTTEYGATTAAGSVPSGYDSYIYKAELVGLQAESTYHYRLVTGSGWSMTDDRSFTTGTTREIDFAFASWSDSQGSNHGAWSADPLEPTVSMMAHMAQSEIAFGLSTGDLAESGSSYFDTRNYYLDRVAKYLGQTVPWFNAWGNHESSTGGVLRRFADMPSKDRPGRTPGFGSFYFTYANSLFIAIDYSDEQAITDGWLEDLLQSPINQNARFTVVGIHVPPYCELWIDGNSHLRTTLVPLMEEYGVDLCISGHTHEYERGFQNGVQYVITGGGSWLDFPESLVHDWPHMTVGGHHDLPGTWARESSPGVLGPPQPIRGGLVNEYVRFEVRGDRLEGQMHAFNADGSYIGVLDTFTIEPSAPANRPPEFSSSPLEKSAATVWADYQDSLSGDATDPDDDDVLRFAKGSGPAWLRIARDGTLSGKPGESDLGENTFLVRVSDGSGLYDQETLSIRVVPGGPIVGRYVFYNNSAFDSGPGRTDHLAIATDKTPLLPGQKATRDNYTSYTRGINGVMIDVFGLTGTLTAADFQFRTGNNDEPDSWTADPPSPDVAVEEAAGAHGSDRVILRWDDHSIKNEWLQVTMLAGDNTGLIDSDVFYFGNAVGESGDSPFRALVNATDEILARNFQHGPFNRAGIDDRFDYNRDQLVNASDQIIARAHQTGLETALQLITVPDGKGEPGLPQPVPVNQGINPTAAVDPALNEGLVWLHNIVRAGAHRPTSEDTDKGPTAVDALLATYWP